MLRLLRSATASEPLDLRSSPAFGTRLLDDGWEWRERVVQELEFDLGNHVRVTSSYQVALPSAFVEDCAPTVPRAVRALWPITTRPKQLLLDFDVIGPDGGTAHLVRRAVVGGLQTEYLLGIARAEDAEECIPWPLLRAVCLQTPALIASATAQRAPDTGSLCTFLGQGLGVTVRARQVDRWLERIAPVQRCSPIGRTSRPIATAPPRTSSSRYPTSSRCRPPWQRSTHWSRCTAMASRRPRREALTFLGVLAEYGRRWELFIEAVLPVESPATIRLIETRRLELSWRGETRQPLALREGASEHVEARLRDAAVVFAGFSVLNADGGGTVGVEAGLIEGTRDTPESLSLYSSDARRPYAVVLRLRLRPTGYVRHAFDLVVVLIVAALSMALVVPDNDDLLGALSLLTVPTTFAATLLLTREQTALAGILLRRRRVLAAAATSLWLVALLRLSCGLPA